MRRERMRSERGLALFTRHDVDDSCDKVIQFCTGGRSVRGFQPEQENFGSYLLPSVPFGCKANAGNG